MIREKYILKLTYSFKVKILKMLPRCAFSIPKQLQDFLGQQEWLLCISTSEQVLRMLFAGQNQIFNAKTTFCILFSQ